MKFPQTLILKTQEDLIIDQAKINDAESIIDYANMVAGETDNLTFGKNQFHLSVQDEIKIIQQALNYNLKLIIIGKINNNIVSCLNINRDSRERILHIGHLGISVLKKHWGKSIGTKMVECAIAWSSNNGITKLQLEALTENSGAIHLYKKLGFKIEGEISQAHKIGNKYYSAYIMGIEL